MKIWNKEQFGDTFKKVKKIEFELNKLEEDTIQRQLSQQKEQKRKQLQEDLWAAAQAHESANQQHFDCNSLGWAYALETIKEHSFSKRLLHAFSWLKEQNFHNIDFELDCKL